ncbi:Uncharacterised protein [Enterobacter cloacae]|nr:Uncharacterised protein [Enterobacter cloacae]
MRAVPCFLVFALVVMFFSSGAIAGAGARGYLLMPMKGSGEPLAM